MILEVRGNLAKEDYIAHQCNCVTKSAYGLSLDIANKYPWADVYRGRRAYDTPGTIKVVSDETKHVICMFAQWTPSRCGRFAKSYPATYVDTRGNREMWFKMCIDHIDALELERVAVPYMIGCGMAGGNWETYKKMLQDAKTLFVIYKL